MVAVLLIVLIEAQSAVEAASPRSQVVVTKTVATTLATSGELVLGDGSGGDRGGG